MLFTLPRQLHYPITITKFLVKEGDDIELGTQLFTYTYTTTVSQVDRFRERKDVQMTYPTTYESPIEGKFMGWKIEEKTYVERPIIVAEVEELCAHDVIFGGMCAICGKDMTRVESYLEPTPQQARVRIRNEDSEVTVSQAELNRNEEAAKLRLLKDKKLSLVVDLDQTIIHATVDPTVAEWQNDPTNPNYDAVKDVRAFQLAEDIPTRQDGKRGSAKARANKDAKDASTSSTASNGCWYYIKLRPGLMEFLEKVSQIYELHIYTMGTKAYAQEVAKLVDPDKKIFGNRILSRDDSGSLTVKNLQRLFPVDQKMVVIIDDRGDVWKWSENLIKVAPYDFFVGIGDINSSFLPEKPALKQEEQQDEEKEAKQDEESLAEQEKGRTSSTDEGQDDVSTLQQLVKMGGGDNPGLLQEQTEKRDETIQHQVEDRPLLRQQKALDEDSAPSTPEGDAAGEVDDSTESHKSDLPSTPSTSEESKEQRNHLLKDDDRELDHIYERLKMVHDEFFEVFERRKVNHGIPKDKIELSLLPEVKNIMSSIKWKILEGVKIVYTGVLPLGVNVQDADLSLWAKSFGATIQPKINPRSTTHVVAGKPRTAKVKEAAKWPKKIKIVKLNWLLDSLTQWQKLDETEYLMTIHPEDRRNAKKARKEGKEVEDVESDRAKGLDDGADVEDFEDDDDDSELYESEDYDGSSMLSEEDEEAEKVLERQIQQSAGLTPTSVIGISEEDRDAVDDELREFLGSDADDSSEESDAELAEFLSKKRKRDEDEELDSEASNIPELAHQAKRPTGLREVQNAADEPRPKSPGLTPPPGTTIPTKSARAQAAPPTLDPLRGGDLEAIDYNPHSPGGSPEEAAKDPTYTAADAYDNDNYDRGGKYQLGGVVQPAEEYDAEGDDDELEREMNAAFEEGDWGAPEEEAHAEGIEQGNEGGPDVALKEGDVGDLTEEQKEAQEEGQFGLWGGEGNGPLGVGDPRFEEGDETYTK